jgi:hypothetical protein
MCTMTMSGLTLKGKRKLKESNLIICLLGPVKSTDIGFSESWSETDLLVNPRFSVT